MASKTEKLEDERCGRRTGADRRTRKLEIEHVDRRRGERRSGSDRRAEPRADT